MQNNFTAHATVTIHAPIAKVWDALINPAMIKQYLFGTEAISEWQVGSSITYKGVWQGKSYEDKGKILELTPEKSFVSTYWSSMSGTEDKPENYATVSYALQENDGQTVVSVTQNNNATEESAKHSEKNWKTVLETMKKLLER